MQIDFYNSDYTFNKFLSSLDPYYKDDSYKHLLYDFPKVAVYDYETQKYYLKQRVNGCKEFYFKGYTLAEFKKTFTNAFDSKFSKWCIEIIQQYINSISCVSFLDSFHFKWNELSDEILNGNDEIFQLRDVEEFQKYTIFLQLLNTPKNKTKVNWAIKHVYAIPDTDNKQFFSTPQTTKNNAFNYFLNYIWKLCQIPFNSNKRHTSQCVSEIFRQQPDTVYPMQTVISINMDQTPIKNGFHIKFNFPDVKQFLQPYFDYLHKREILEITNTQYIKDNFGILGPVRLILYYQDEFLSDEEIVNEYKYIQKLITKEYIGFQLIDDKEVQKRNNIGCIIIGQNLKQELFQKAKLINCELNLGNLNNLYEVLTQSVQNVIEDMYVYLSSSFGSGALCGSHQQYDLRNFAKYTFEKYHEQQFHPRRDLPQKIIQDKKPHQKRKPKDKNDEKLKE